MYEGCEEDVGRMREDVERMRVVLGAVTGKRGERIGGEGQWGAREARSKMYLLE